MLGLIFKILGFLFSFWRDLSPETKERIINVVVDAFEEVFRAFYRSFIKKA